MARPCLAAFVLASSAVAAACAPVGEPDLGVLPTSTTSTTIQAASDADRVVAPAAAPAPFVTQLTPTRPVDFTPQVLVADEEGVGLLDGPVMLPGIVADRVVDDHAGGVVVEQVLGTGRRVEWYPAGSDLAQVVAVGAPRLMDVGFANGSVQAVVADEASIRLVRLGDPDERVLMTLEPGTTAVSVSAAAGLYAVVLGDAACGALEFRGPEGAPVDVGAVQAPQCQTPGRPAFGLVAFSPDGETFAYTERQFRPDAVVTTTDLVVKDLQGKQLHRSQVGGEAQRIRNLSLDQHLVMLLRDTADGAELVLLDLRRPGEVEVVPVPGARTATLTRVPLALAPDQG
jgi:hypothetical protein